GVIGHSPTEQFRETGLSPSGIPVGPSRVFWFGTDNLGRDVLVRVIYGTRISLLVGVGSSVLAVLVGGLIGIAAGWFGGWLDAVFCLLMDVVLSLPVLMFALALVAVVGQSLLISIVVIAFFSWASVGRIVRGQTISIREQEYVSAARLMGAGNARIIFVEILP